MTGETFGSECWLEYEVGSRVYGTNLVSHKQRRRDLDSEGLTNLHGPASVCCTVIASYSALHDVPIVDRSV